MSLLVSDLLCVILSIVLFSLPRLFPTMYSLVIAPRLVPILLPLDEIALTVSIYVTVGVAIERWFSVCKPHKQMMENAGLAHHNPLSGISYPLQ